MKRKDVVMRVSAPHGILKLSCPDKMGIVAVVSRYLFEQNCNIIDSSQFGDHVKATFFLRTFFTLPAGKTVADIEAGFTDITREFAMDAHFNDTACKTRALIMAPEIRSA